jgi:ATP-dependent DNA ligase
LAASAAAAEPIKAKSFTIDGEAVVLGPDGLSRFEELQRRTAAHAAIFYAFDLIEHSGEDLRNLPFLDRKTALERLLRNSKAGILFNEHIAGDGAIVFAHACRLGAEGIVSKKVWRVSIRPVPRLDQGPQSLGSPCSGSGVRFGIDNIFHAIALVTA